MSSVLSQRHVLSVVRHTPHGAFQRRGIEPAQPPRNGSQKQKQPCWMIYARQMKIQIQKQISSQQAQSNYDFFIFVFKYELQHGRYRNKTESFLIIVPLIEALHQTSSKTRFRASQSSCFCFSVCVCLCLIVFVSAVYYSELARDAIPGTEPGIRRRQNQDQNSARANGNSGNRQVGKRLELEVTQLNNPWSGLVNILQCTHFDFLFCPHNHVMINPSIKKATLNLKIV